MEFFRLFTAVRPPTDILDAIVEAQLRFREQIDADSVRWVGRDNMHVTLQFLGDTPAGQVQDVMDAMADGVSLIAGQSEIDLTVTGVGAFPSAQRPRVVWIGIQDGSGELARLQRA
ncbi:MAG: RNA 2',3'-cyclic phosphodiesterase, partial [Spirochaetaceae bacterium]|nr:RNA 2',3'-cyclic phosphodiesterase [Spirochaetaceae bacterium]